MKKIALICLLSASYMITFAQKGFQIKEQKEGKKIDVLYNGKLLTAYRYDDSIMKPFLYPINTVGGVTVTRGYPIAPVAGDRTDHPHHTGIWMNYESVNGLDFWNNSTAIAPEKRNAYGTIRHDKLIEKREGSDKASLTVTANWHRPDGHVLINEKTTYTFSVQNNRFLIDRQSTLTATSQDVVFKDVKDGFIAIRVARELEMPSKEPGVFIDAQGNKTEVPVNNNGVSGMYYGSNGKKGDSLWSTKGDWAILTGIKNGKNVTIAIIDHPSNIGYPTYWHARGYGLFAANPLGRKIFSNGKEDLNFTLKPNTSTRFQYRFVIADEMLKPENMTTLVADFSKRQ